MTQATLTLSPVRVPVNHERRQGPPRPEQSPRQLAEWLSNRRPSVCRLAEPAFKTLWDSGEFFALEDLLRDVRAVMLDITPGPNATAIKSKVTSQLNRLMGRVTGSKHHGFEHCLRNSRPGRVIPFVPSKPRSEITTEPVFQDLPTPSDHHMVEYLPTPEEIARMTAEIRAGWSEEERLCRQHALPGDTSKPKSQARTCQKCGESFVGYSARLRCEGCERQHQRTCRRDRTRARRAGARKAVAK